ncbi:unnamed protein product [Urochloa decumbens]|uniref:DUF4283 domain-containing protein n=1 Tax=Urochloa decumbens TaxID=240449 RepID=A0ABC9H376_9POAL
MLTPIMAGRGSGRDGGSASDPDPDVAEMLRKLNLTAEEGEVAAFSDDEDGDGKTSEMWALVGKVLSPTVVHANTVSEAMRSAWGNPYKMKIRSISEKAKTLFVAEFGFKQDMERALGGSPWVVGKHAVILRDYDDRMIPSKINFDKIEMWARILNLPLGWMNLHRGVRAMGLLGDVIKMDVDAEGKASGPFLRARVAIDLSKAPNRGVLLKTDKTKLPEWFDAQYEKLPFFCHNCGVIGHGDLECDIPVQRNALGKLPYDIALRAPEDRKKKLQSFAQAAAETYGSVLRALVVA